MKTDDLIVDLARSLRPVATLPAPSIRFARWTAAMTATVAVGALLIGLRGDLFTALGQPAFIGRAAATLLAAVLAAASAFTLSVPGAERSPVQRVLPLAAVSAWAVLLVALLTSGGDPVRRLLELPVNWPCGMKIAVLSLVPGWVMLTMLRRAAPLQRVWTAAFAALAAVALAAAATQFICPVDDAAHQLVGHVLPVAFLSALGTAVGFRTLEWLPTAGRRK